MKIDVIKDGHIRAIKPSKLQNYLDDGWKQLDSKTVEEKIVLRPPAQVKAAVKSAEDDAIEQGE